MEEIVETSSTNFLTSKEQLQNPNESTTKNPKKSRGRQKIEFKEIEVKSKRHVAFSKRRLGLFKKAAQLSVLTGAKIAIVTFSKFGRVYKFGHVDTLIDKYLRKIPVSLDVCSGDDVAEEEGKPWWETPVESVAEEDLGEYVAALSSLMGKLGQRIVDMGNNNNNDRAAEIVPAWPINMMGSNPTVDMQSLENTTDGITRNRVGQNVNYCYY
ncbi:unnamed protein product [Cochlearia groenlandica]